jgi:hypothetical protein
MGNIKIVAGDIPEGKWSLKTSWSGETTINNFFLSEKILITDAVQSIEIMTEESKKKFLGAFVGGTAGALILGPVGLLAGVLTGGQKKEVTFACYFKDGRKLLATTDAKTFAKLQASCF